MNRRPGIEVRRIVHLPWTPLLPADVDDTGPGENAGGFQTRGPGNLPRRPRLEPSAGPGGVVARVLGTDGLPRALAVLPEAADPLVRLPGPPLSLGARRDGGLWSLERNRLCHLSGAGAVLATVEVKGIGLTGAADDATWVADLDQAIRVRADGHIDGVYPFVGVPGVVGWSGMLCSIEGTDARRVRCLDRDGTVTFPTLPSPPGPFERLIALGDDTMLTSTVDTLRIRRRGGSTGDFRMSGAGLTTGGRPFFCHVDGTTAVLWIGSDEARRIRLDAASLAALSTVVVAVDGERVLLWAGDRAAWYRDGDVERSFPVDTATYGREIFPHAWRVEAPYPFTAGRDGGVLIPVGGPTGLAILELRFNDPPR